MNVATSPHRIEHANPLWVLPSLDTFELLARRLTALLRPGRRITYISRYINTEGADNLRIERDLLIEDTPVVSINPDHASFVARTNNLTSIFVETSHSTEVRARNAWDRRDKANWKCSRVSRVHLDGRGDEGALQDLIEIERWNEYGVGEIVTVVFHR